MGHFFKSKIFYHGTGKLAAEKIQQNGFADRETLTDEDFKEGFYGPYLYGGNLGNGIYLSQSRETAEWFGPYVFQCSLLNGTRLLDTSMKPDLKVVSYLRKEFGHNILKAEPFKALPKNKKLTQKELIELTRYNYSKCWSESWAQKPVDNSWTKKRDDSFKALEKCYSALKRYGFDGYGNPQDDNGVVIYAVDKIVEVKLILTPESTDLKFTRTPVRLPEKDLDWYR